MGETKGVLSMLLDDENGLRRAIPLTEITIYGIVSMNVIIFT